MHIEDAVSGNIDVKPEDTGAFNVSSSDLRNIFIIDLTFSNSL